MVFEDLGSTSDVWKRDLYPSIETTRASQSFVQTLRIIGGCDKNDACAGVETIQLCQKLIESLLCISGIACIPRPTDGVQLIDEDDCWCFGTGLGEQFANTSSSHPDIHFVEFRARHVEDRTACFSGYGTSKHSLSCSWRSNEKDALGKLAT